ncbi:hypothetical protein DSL92_00565 [Billgrantia gudaonensis]|uniref:Carboxyltransferase domain-containing protein n=1 Tax=Billgrantia gudaonensis TaxID=376427 RepID=A0A3S0NHU5_9GAMM|nr:hypothetical protein DSL92_00565 [Halomonas gudaonensis]
MGLRVLRSGPWPCCKTRALRRTAARGDPGWSGRRACSGLGQSPAGNPGESRLEITFGGLSLAVSRSDRWPWRCRPWRHPGMASLPLWQRVRVREGLTFDTPRCGLRLFGRGRRFRRRAGVGQLRLRGAWGSAVMTVMVSAWQKGRPSGFAEDTLMFPHRMCPMKHGPTHAAASRLLPGAQIADFHAASLHAAFNAEWRVDDRADRMGVRLRGPTLRCRIDTMISEGLGLGAVQVPPDVSRSPAQRPADHRWLSRL